MCIRDSSRCIGFDVPVTCLHCLRVLYIKEATPKYKAVSYTHLDVYKRQVTGLIKKAKVDYLNLPLGSTTGDMCCRVWAVVPTNPK